MFLSLHISKPKVILWISCYIMLIKFVHDYNHSNVHTRNLKFAFFKAPHYSLQQENESLNLVSNTFCVVSLLWLKFICYSLYVYLLVCLFTFLETSVSWQRCKMWWVVVKCNWPTAEAHIFLLLIIVEHGNQDYLTTQRR